MGSNQQEVDSDSKERWINILQQQANLHPITGPRPSAVGLLFCFISNNTSPAFSDQDMDKQITMKS